MVLLVTRRPHWRWGFSVEQFVLVAMFAAASRVLLLDVDVRNDFVVWRVRNHSSPHDKLCDGAG